MRLYVKLTLIVMTFLGLTRLSMGDDSTPHWASDAWFSARCYVAHLLNDRSFTERLITEAQLELRQKMPAPDCRLSAQPDHHGEARRRTPGPATEKFSAACLAAARPAIGTNSGLSQTTAAPAACRGDD